jgi:predicted small secreted protein
MTTPVIYIYVCILNPKNIKSFKMLFNLRPKKQKETGEGSYIYYIHMIFLKNYTQNATWKIHGSLIIGRDA